jgi:hypothetical protein
MARINRGAAAQMAGKWLDVRRTGTAKGAHLRQLQRAAWELCPLGPPRRAAAVHDRLALPEALRVQALVAIERGR